MRKFTGHSIWAFVLLGLLGAAVAPWGLASVFGPLIPPDLPKTPTAYVVEQTRIAGITPTATPQDTLTPTQTPAPTSTPTRQPLPTPTPIPVVYGTAQSAIEVFSCPDTSKRLGKTISVGQSFQVIGYNFDIDGRLWLLVKDLPENPQEWIQTQDSAKIEPSDYMARLKRTACRL